MHSSRSSLEPATPPCPLPYPQPNAIGRIFSRSVVLPGNFDSTQKTYYVMNLFYCLRGEAGGDEAKMASRYCLAEAHPFAMEGFYAGTVKHAYKNMGHKNNRGIFLSLEVI